MAVILAIDQGTTGTTALLFDQHGRALGRGYAEITQYYPQPGWVEHDPQEIWQSVLRAVIAARRAAGLSPESITAIGLTNQRETVLVWDAVTGQPLHRAIVWQCRRTAALCADLRARGYEPEFRRRTGLLLDPYFSGTKLAWLLDHLPGARDLAAAGRLRAGTVDTWLLWHLTGGQVHATDVSNASRTLLLNLHTGRWDDDLLAVLNIPSQILPVVRPSSGDFGQTVEITTDDGERVLAAGIPIRGVAGDQQAALFGQACFEPGMVKVTYGTGSFLLMHTGTRPVLTQSGLLTTIAWGLEDRLEYALEGSVFIAGAAVQWLRDGLGIIRQASEVEALATSVPDSGGVYFVPAFVGLGAPYWDAYARGLLIGLTRGTTRAHLARATLEAIAYQVYDVVQTMADEAGLPPAELRIDGGAAVNNFLAQFQSDITGVPVVRPTQTETTALGAAYLAGLGAGVWRSRADLRALWQAERRFHPQMAPEQRARLLRDWRRAVERARGWAGPAEGTAF